MSGISFLLSFLLKLLAMTLFERVNLEGQRGERSIWCGPCRVSISGKSSETYIKDVRS